MSGREHGGECVDGAAGGARLLRMVPGLLDAARQLHTTRPEQSVVPLVLVKVGEADLAWLAAEHRAGGSSKPTASRRPRSAAGPPRVPSWLTSPAAGRKRPASPDWRQPSA
ncbi:hypothetical protein [Micromonospora sp. LOL_023]|uniref:hypothetical protein n=1 Tax=Micromonospora sp. LOL_023 TaxID=3345418 RepID=UPI003A86BA4E